MERNMLFSVTETYTNNIRNLYSIINYYYSTNLKCVMFFKNMFFFSNIHWQYLKLHYYQLLLQYKFKMFCVFLIIQICIDNIWNFFSIVNYRYDINIYFNHSITTVLIWRTIDFCVTWTYLNNIWIFYTNFYRLLFNKDFTLLWT